MMGDYKLISLKTPGVSLYMGKKEGGIIFFLTKDTFYIEGKINTRLFYDALSAINSSTYTDSSCLKNVGHSDNGGEDRVKIALGLGEEKMKDFVQVLFLVGERELIRVFADWNELKSL